MAFNRQTALNQRTVIPQHIEHAMTQQLQQSAPAHLRKYIGADKPAYVPQHVERELAQYMQKAMPTHLKQYSGAYLQQRVVEPSVRHSVPGSSTVSSLPSQPPMPDRLRLDHAMPTTGQYTVDVPQSSTGYAQASPGTPLPGAFPVQDQTPQPTNPQPAAYPPGPGPGPESTYGFIMEPGQPKARRSLPGGKSLLGRLVIAFGGLLVLIILFSVIKGLLSPSNIDLPSAVSVAQDQQEMVHLATSATQQQGLSTANQNFAMTAKLSLASAQSQLIVYLQNNHKKVSTKTLNLKVSLATDRQLTAAVANSTYDQTFQQIMQSKLTSYEQALKQAYAQNKGPKGRQLLSNEYASAQLLLKQLNAPAS